MKTVTKRMYEALFLVDSGIASTEWDDICGHIRSLLDRCDGEVVSMEKWDERRLCYEISGKNRGTYILVYFNGDPSKIAGLERDVQLSERIMRVMILRGDEIPEEDVQKETPAMAAERQSAEAAERRAQQEENRDDDNDDDDNDDDDS